MRDLATDTGLALGVALLLGTALTADALPLDVCLGLGLLAVGCTLVALLLMLTEPERRLTGSAA
jgi:hypothetical protein